MGMQSFYGAFAASSFCQADPSEGVDLDGLAGQPAQQPPLRGTAEQLPLARSPQHDDGVAPTCGTGPGRPPTLQQSFVPDYRSRRPALESADHDQFEDGPRHLPPVALAGLQDAAESAVGSASRSARRHVPEEPAGAGSEPRPWEAAASADADAYIAKAAGLIPSVCPSPHNLDLETCSFADWLGRACPAGRLLRYLGRAQENYDTVDQIVRAYVTQNSHGAELDDLFYEDMGVVDAEHRRLFEAWFAEACGAMRLLNSPAVATRG